MGSSAISDHTASHLFGCSEKIMGVDIETLQAGDGASFPRAGQKVECHYVLTLTNGTKVDRAREPSLQSAQTWATVPRESPAASLLTPPWCLVSSCSTSNELIPAKPDNILHSI